MKKCMKKAREEVNCATELEFVTMVAKELIDNMNVKDRECLIDNPHAIDYHFSYSSILEIILIVCMAT